MAYRSGEKREFHRRPDRPRESICLSCFSTVKVSKSGHLQDAEDEHRRQCPTGMNIPEAEFRSGESTPDSGWVTEVAKRNLKPPPVMCSLCEFTAANCLSDIPLYIYHLDAEHPGWTSAVFSHGKQHVGIKTELR
jgi:hypothetical protein